MTLDQDVVGRLNRSREIFGEFVPILVDGKTGEDISGAHRRAAGFKVTLPIDVHALAVKANLSDEVTKALLRGHANIQRQMSEEESKAVLLSLAEEYERQGLPKEKIARKVVEKSFLSEARTLSLLPSKYKDGRKAQSPGRPPKSVITRKQEVAETPVENEKTTEKAATIPQEVDTAGEGERITAEEVEAVMPSSPRKQEIMGADRILEQVVPDVEYLLRLPEYSLRDVLARVPEDLRREKTPKKGEVCPCCFKVV